MIFPSKKAEKRHKIAKAHYQNMLDNKLSSLRKCAEAAGFAPASVFHYFSGLKDLNEYVLREFIVDDLDCSYVENRNNMIKHLRKPSLVSALFNDNENSVDLRKFDCLNHRLFLIDLAMANWDRLGGKNVDESVFKNISLQEGE